MKRPCLLFATIALVVLGCARSEKKSAPTVQNALPTDTMRIEGKSVVFFSVSQPEFDALEKDSSSGVAEVMGDFGYYMGIVSDSLESRGFRSVSTASRYIQIIYDNNAVEVFDRLSDKDSYTGYILTDGKKKSIIRFGVATDADIIQDLDRFSGR